MITSPSKTGEIKRTAPIGPEAELLSDSRLPSAKNLTILDHPIAQHALASLRDRQTPMSDFRLHCQQLLLALAFEATRTVPTREKSSSSSDGEGRAKVLAKPVVFLAVTRQALGLTAALADFIPGVAIGSVNVSASPENDRPQARLHLANSPSLGDARIILFDPIIATGLSVTLALNLVRRSGASDISLINFVSSDRGLKRIRETFPTLPIWSGAVDDDWDSKRGPVPGIWNFEERVNG